MTTALMYTIYGQGNKFYEKGLENLARGTFLLFPCTYTFIPLYFLLLPFN